MSTGIDVTRLLKEVAQDAPKDQVDSLLDEVFAVPAIPVDSSANRGVSQPSVSPGKVAPVSPQGIGKMLYDGKEVDVFEGVDQDGYTMVKDKRGWLQVKAADLKPLAGLVEPSRSNEGVAEKKGGFWDSYFGDMVERMGAGLYMLNGSLWSATDKLHQFLKWTNPVVSFPNELLNKYREVKSGKTKSWMQEQAENGYHYAQVLRERSDRYEGKDYSQLLNEGDYGGMFGEVFLTASESFPQSLVAALGGGAGLVLTGVATGAQRYDELDAMPETKDLPEFEKALNAVSYGVFEAMFEKLGDALVGKTLKNVYKLRPHKEVESVVQDELTAWMDKQFKRYGVLWMPVSEGVEEVATQVADNITDYCTGVSKEWKPLEGCFDAFVYGAAGGMQFSAVGAPGAAINFYNKRKSKRDYQKAKVEFGEQFGEAEAEGFADGILFMSPAEQEATLGSIARSGEYSEDQLGVVTNLMNRSNHYKAWYEPKIREKEREARKEMLIQRELQDYRTQIMPYQSDNGMFQEVFLNGGENAVFIVKGTVATREDKGQVSVDAEKSSPELYYLDESGAMQVTTPEHLSGVNGIYSADEVLAAREVEIRGGYEQWENIERGTGEPSPTPKEAQEAGTGEAGSDQTGGKVENGDSVVYERDGEVVKGVVADAHSNQEYVFMENGDAVQRNEVSQEQPTEKAAVAGMPGNGTSEVEAAEATPVPQPRNVKRATSEPTESVDVSEQPTEKVVETEIVENRNEVQKELPKVQDEVAGDVSAPGVSVPERRTNKEKKKLHLAGTQEAVDKKVKAEAEQPKSEFGSQNTIISPERYQELKRQWLEKTRGQLNANFDPELFSIGVQMAAFHIEAGARRFADFTRSMVADLGESIRPYLKSFYEGAKHMPGMDFVSKDMDSSDFVATFNVNEDAKEAELSDEVFVTIQHYYEEAQRELSDLLAKQQRFEKEGNGWVLDRDIEGKQRIIRELEEKYGERLKVAELSDDEFDTVRAKYLFLLRKLEELNFRKRSYEDEFGSGFTQNDQIKNCLQLLDKLEKRLGKRLKDIKVEDNQHPALTDLLEQRIKERLGDNPNVIVGRVPKADAGGITEGQAVKAGVTDSKRQGDRTKPDVRFPTKAYSTEGIEMDYPSDEVAKRIRKDMKPFVTALHDVLGWDYDTDRKGKVDAFHVNIAPAGGDVYFVFWKPGTDVGVYVSLTYQPSYSRANGYDDYRLEPSFLWRLTTKENKWTGLRNQYHSTDATVGELADLFEKEVFNYLKRNEDEGGLYSDRSLADTGRDHVTELDAGVDADGNLPDVSGEQAERLSDGTGGTGGRGARTGEDGRGNTDRGDGGRDGDSSVSGQGGRSDKGSPDTRADQGDRGLSERDASLLKESENGEGQSPTLNNRNYVIRDERIVPHGEVAKIRANIKAIEVLKRIESKKRPASREEREVLSRYSGWGGLAEVLSTEKYGNASWVAKYRSFHDELKELLTPDEFTSAVNSTLNAHFTSGKVVRALWGLAERLGFEGGKVLEPAAGIGNFLGLMPPHLSAKSSIRAYELDSVTGRMLTHLYPDAGVKVAGYESSNDRNFDLIITNVPFGHSAPYDSRHKDLSKFSLHNYFIAKGITQLRPGGIGIFITSATTMDGMTGGKFREWVTQEGHTDFVGGFRLPNNAFAEAGTEVTCDVLVFRKRDRDAPSPFAEPFRIAVPFQEAKTEKGELTMIHVNEYYASHPDRMLGVPVLAYTVNKGGLYSGDDVTLSPRPGVDLSTALDKVIGEFVPIMTGTSSPEQVNYPALLANEGDKEGSLVVRDGELRVVMDGELVVPTWVNESTSDSSGRKVARKVVAQRYVELRGTINELVDAEVNDKGNIEALRERLNQEYDEFTGRFGRFYQNAKFRFLADSDVDYNSVFALEQVETRYIKDKSGQAKKQFIIRKSDIFTKRISYPVSKPTQADSLTDALHISLAYEGRIDLSYISGLVGVSEDEARQGLLSDGQVYVNPMTGLLEDRDSYLSGSVRKKYAEALAAAETDGDFQKNVDDLKRVIPDDLLPSQIRFRLGSVFIPGKFVEDFIKEKLDITATVKYQPSVNRWIIDKVKNQKNPKNVTIYGTGRINGLDLVEKGLNLQQPVIYDVYVDDDKREVRVKNAEATVEAQGKLNEIADEFVDFVRDNEEFCSELARIYNEQCNGFVEKRYSEPVIAHFPGANEAVTLRVHQKKGVARCLQNCTLLAHQVGSGKTYTIITAAMEMRRLGIARKPLIVVQNNTIEQFVASFRFLYPGAKILAPTKVQMDAKNRVRLFNMILYGDFDAIVIPQSFVSMMPDSPERIQAHINEQISELEALLMEVDPEDERSLHSQLSAQLRGLEKQLDKSEGDEDGAGKKAGKVKDKARRQLGIVKRITRQADRKVDDVRNFEELGIDALFVDEAHNFKRLGLITKLANIKGVDTSASQRAFSMLMKVRHVQEKTGGKNVVFATGTPISNTLAEAWTMLRYIAPEILEEYGVSRFDEFASVFGSIEQSLEFSSTGTFKLVDRFKAYVNLPELQKMFRARVDVVLSEDIPEFREGKSIPRLKGGQFTQKIIPQSDGLKMVMAELKARMREWEDLPPREKKKNCAVPLLVFKEARQAAIDLRLLDPEFDDVPDSKTNVVVGEVLRIYQETHDQKGTQLVFCDLYQSPAKSGGWRFNLYREIKDKLVEGGIPEDEVAIINECPEGKRELLFTQVQTGEVRVLIGGTEKMGVGVNVQDRLAALHHIDAPARPMDFEQRNGRILRQGNMYAELDIPVEVLTYGVEKTLDATAYQRLAIKQGFINQIMRGEDVGREIEDVAAEDNSSDMTFEQMMATLTGSQYAILHSQRTYELKKLQMSKKNYERRLVELNKELKDAQRIVQRHADEAKDLGERTAIIEKYFPEGKISSIRIDGKVYTEKLGEKMDEALEEYAKKCKKKGRIVPLFVGLNDHPNPAKVELHYFLNSLECRYAFDVCKKGEESRIASIVQSGQGFLSSINSSLKKESVAKLLDEFNKRKSRNEARIPVLQEELKKPFGKEDRLRELEQEVAELAEKMKDEVEANEAAEIAEAAKVKEVMPQQEDVEADEGVMFREADRWRVINRKQVKRESDRLSRELGIQVATVNSRVDLPASVQARMSEGRRYPGVFFPESEQAFVVLDEVTDADDLRRTVLHEFVGHKGLRGLLGDKLGFFCNEVLASLDSGKRDVLLGSYGGDRSLAAQEYVASFAEGYKDPSGWLKVKGIWNEVLRRLGVRLRLGDADLKFLLWKAIKGLRKTGSLTDQISRAAQEYSLFRAADESFDYEQVSELEVFDTDKLRLHNEVVSSRFQFAEAYQDRMLALKRMQELIEEHIGLPIPDYMDAYVFENTLASRNKYEMEFFRNNFLRPLTRAIANLEHSGMTRREVENYVILKHGLERNEYIRKRKLEEVLAPLLSTIEEIEKMEGMTPEDEARYDELLQEVADLREAMTAKLAKADFAGVDVVAKEVENGDAAGFVDAVEGSYAAGVYELWGRIRAANDFSLKKWFESGMIDRKGYEHVGSMFQWYVPLRGFDETIAEDVYEYFSMDKSAFNSPLRRMGGRRSRADNPFAFIASQAESSIVGGNKNLMKLHLFRLAQKYPSELMSVSKVWYELTGEDEEGNPVFEGVLPSYDDDAEQYRRNIEVFNARMLALEKEGKARRGRGRLKIGLKTLGQEAEEHAVRVRQNGEDFAVLVHGNPRAAQAVNGLNDQERIDNRLVRGIQQMNRQLAANFTTRNPAFVASNLCRDFIFSCSTLGIKEGGRYRHVFVRNIPKASGAIVRYLRGKTDVKRFPEDVLFMEFLENGGETGYTALYHLDKYKQMIDAEVASSKRGKVTKTVLSVLDFFESGNRWAEDLSRFAVYMTSRQDGRTVLVSVSNAKEVTVNFNRKGSGAKGAQVFRSLYLFFNAAVQSLANFSVMLREHPVKTSVMVASYAAMGVIVPMLVAAFGGDDALEEFLNLPDYVRKNNVCIWLGRKKGFTTIPLPIELRAFNGLGDAAFRYFSGEISGKTASAEVLTGFADLLPLNPAGGGTPFVPDAVKPFAESYYTNRDFTGRPIARVTPFNGFEPEYKKVYRGTGAFFVRSSEVLNDVTGGDYATRGYFDRAGGFASDLVSANVNVTHPAAFEHLFESYLGGMYTTFSQALKLGAEGYRYASTGKAEVEARDIPIGNRFYYQGGLWGKRTKVNERYFKALDELRETEHRLRRYNEGLNTGAMDVEKAMKGYADLELSGALECADVVKYYSKEIGRLNDVLHGGDLSVEEGEELEGEILLLKEQMLGELKELKRKRKVQAE